MKFSQGGGRFDTVCFSQLFVIYLAFFERCYKMHSRKSGIREICASAHVPIQRRTR
nr:MAG TPA: hypothetical protein [Caudoviricetes sp.]